MRLHLDTGLKRRDNRAGITLHCGCNLSWGPRQASLIFVHHPPGEWNIFTAHVVMTATVTSLQSRSLQLWNIITLANSFCRREGHNVNIY